VVLSPAPRHTLRLTYNEAFQVPNYSEFFLQADVAPPVNLSAFEDICLLDGIFCGFNLDFDLTEGSLATGETRVLALGNADLEVEEIRTFELGYAAALGTQGLLQVDLYRSKNESFITDLLNQLTTPLGRVNPNFGPYEPPADLSPERRALLLAGLQSALGPLFPFLSNNVDGTPILARASYANFGAVDTWGADLALSYNVTPQLAVQVAYSWFDFEIRDSRPGLDHILLPNSPENKGSAALSWAADRWDASLSYRWVDDFRWVVGPFQGDVLSYSTVDLVMNVRLSRGWALGVNVANLLDEEHWESFGGDLLGRRALANLSFGW